VTAYMSRATHKSKLNLLLADISKGLCYQFCEISADNLSKKYLVMSRLFQFFSKY